MGHQYECFSTFQDYIDFLTRMEGLRITMFFSFFFLESQC